MRRLFDWACLTCHSVTESTIEVPSTCEAPDQVTWSDLELERCAACGSLDGAERCRVHAIAKYLADRPFSPMVSGGQFDTTGHAPVTPLPEFAGDTFSDFRDFANSKEYREVKKIRESEKSRNIAKRRRSQLIREGANIDVRHCPLPGDPDVTS